MKKIISLGLAALHMIAMVAAAPILLASSTFGQSQHQSDSARNESLKKFLQTYVGTPASEAEKGTQYSFAFTDLKGDGKSEAIVYLWNDGWCGSGGCTALILAPKDSTYEVVTKTTVTRLPIRVLASKVNGWHDISVIVAGGGVGEYEAKLSFDGKTYPTNPSVPPARQVRAKGAGRVVIAAAADGKPLF